MVAIIPAAATIAKKQSIINGKILPGMASAHISKQIDDAIK
jgi:hypothetical protein